MRVSSSSKILDALRRTASRGRRPADIDVAIEMAGDQAANRNWSAAASHYAEALKLDDTRAPLWVQFAHMNKEAGETEKAVQAYRLAIKLEPDDADAYLHLGHLLKNLGRFCEAGEAFAGCLRADCEIHDAYDQLLHLGWERQNILAVLPVSVSSQTRIGSGKDRLSVPTSLIYDAVHQMTGTGKRSRMMRPK